MALSQHLVQKQTQRLIITQDLRQSIELLPLSNLELQDRIQKEILENPLLEEVGDVDGPPPADSRSPEALETAAETVVAREESEGEENWQSNSREYSADYSPGHAAEKTEKKHQFLQNAVRSVESLAEHLLWQLRLSDLSPAQIQAGEMLISAIDERGFLVDDPAVIIEGSAIAIEDARAALAQIHELDPIGCGARTIAESLFLQARLLKPDDAVTLAILEKHFEDLEKLDYRKIEKNAGFTRDEIEQSLQFIRTLEPYPGTLYSPRQPEYIVPDVIIVDVEGKLEVVINDEYLPGLQVNDEYRDMLRQSGRNSADREYLQTKLNSATWLIKSIRQRRQTLYRVTRAITEFQEEFFRQGPAGLQPLTLRMVAEKVELHESTVSRITTNKYAQTRWGVFELKYFFSSSLNSSVGEGKHSARSIQDRIRQLVSAEDGIEPLSDQQIVDLIQKEGVQIARRTVAKYRKVLRIPPADRRKKVNQLNARPEIR